jgi:hypothetical protein
MILKNMFLSDAATANPDNTFSVLRGGIYGATIPLPHGATPEQIPPLKLALVATIALEVTETGKQHDLEVILMDNDGRRIIPDLKVRFQPSPSHRQAFHNVILDFYIRFPKSGEYAFYVNVDGHELGSQMFSLIFTQQP